LHVVVGMLEIARPETRAAVRSHPQRLGWGIVDAILALVMLPFAVWMGIIDAMVWALANLPTAFTWRRRD
jgi:hypothetical protein